MDGAVHKEDSVGRKLKKGGVYCTSSIIESFQYIKATIVGQVRKVRARDEKEATEAELTTAKMQVEAADAAEDRKHHLNM
ncbi:hypothetical protein QJS10_CPB13g00277 [Acorus calamus]|uniref:Uncharacterized protein n=1 Tax=Acorus calamus TaxID=4465 RepID=A0AAV9DI42_ACOCL|nr:hypothetical protein QJS10_CPB13g00277 [Acorus calamus]